MAQETTTTLETLLPFCIAEARFMLEFVHFPDLDTAIKARHAATADVQRLVANVTTDDLATRKMGDIAIDLARRATQPWIHHYTGC